jgi:hypothetical protein
MSSSGTLSRAPRPSSLADVLDLILDKGLVIDAYVRVSVVGIELLTVDARIVVASVDTYLHFAEAVGRLDLPAQSQGLTELLGGDDEDTGDGDGEDGEGGDEEDEEGGGPGHGEKGRPERLASRLAARGKWDQ